MWSNDRFSSITTTMCSIGSRSSRARRLESLSLVPPVTREQYDSRPAGAIRSSPRGRSASGGTKPLDYNEAVMKTIVVSTDGSPSALEAVRFGLELAEAQQAEAIFV